MRLATGNDFVLLRPALTRFSTQVGLQVEHYTFAKGFDFETAYENLYNAHLASKCYSFGGYLVFVDLITPWFGGKPILQEWFTIRTSISTRPLTEVPAALLTLAKELGCKGVLGGDSSPVGLMAAAYESCGYTPLSKQYFKET